MSGEAESGQSSHTGSVPGPSSLPKRKHRPGLQRVSIACERCRSRKNKCDRKLPECSTCKAAGAVCVVEDRLTNRQYPRGHVEGLEAEVKRLRARVKELEAQLSNVNDRQQVSETPDVVHPSPDVAQRGTPGSLHSSNTPNLSSTSPFDTLADDLQVVSRDVTSNQRYVGDSSGLFFGHIVQAVLLQADYKGEQGPSPNSIRLRIAEKPAEQVLQEFTFPEADVAHLLQTAYFTSWWPALPYLHKPSFLERHLEPCIAFKNKARPVSLFLTLMILALGAIDVRRRNTKFGNKHIEYFRYATENYLQAVLKEDSIETIQGLLLLAQFSVNEHQSTNAWLVTGQAVRTAIDLGLHRNQTIVSQSYDFVELEMRKRVFWSTYALDRNVSITLGRPCAIRDEDIDVPFPQNLSDSDLSSGSLPFEQPFTSAYQPQDMSTFIHIVKLRQIQSRIQALFYSADISRLQELGVQYHQTAIRSQLDQWIAQSPRYTHPTMATFQSTEWFHIAYSHALLLLYRPSPACPIITSDSLQLCADSAISLISSYSSLYAKNKVTYTWIALHSLFMASITMLYTLSVDPNIRASTTKAVVRSNVESCLALFQVMAEYWPLAARCHEIVGRIGNHAAALFEKPDDSGTDNQSGPSTGGSMAEQHFGQINAEFMEWFGTRENQPNFAFTNIEGLNQGGVAMDESSAIHLDNTNLFGNSMDMDLSNLNEIFPPEFDMTIPMMMSAFGSEGQTQSETPRLADTSGPGMRSL